MCGSCVKVDGRCFELPGAETMTIRKLIAAVAALSFVAVSATDAAAKHKRYKTRYGGSYAYVPVAPYGARTPGPPWAQPWECYTDEGYGRYRPCNAGRR
jgi:hypothetical protein